jgi:Peptidase family C25./Propeptide_C25.
MKKLALIVFCSIIVYSSLPAQDNSFCEVTADNAMFTSLKITPQTLIYKKVQTDRGEASIVNIPNGSQWLIKGAPDLPKLTVSLSIPNQRDGIVELVDVQYHDIPNIIVAPSKGKLYRNQKPSEIPYVYGEAYMVNDFFPNQIVTTNQPYIIRNVRGQNFHIAPVQYNPVTKTLRVITSLQIKINYTGTSNINTLPANHRITSIHEYEEQTYLSHFVNFGKKNKRYTPIAEQGSLLILSPAQFLPDMQPYIEWKQRKGFKTFVVNVDTISGGVNETNIRNLVANYYSMHQIAYLLIVGDNQHIPARNADWSQYPALLGPSDNAYAYMVGNDHYPDFVVGRFSGESKADIATQVYRSIQYEKNPLISTNWMQHQIGIASEQGPGDDNQMDFEHMRDILDSNKNFYHYVHNYELYDGSQGGNDSTGNPAPQDLISAISNGAGLLNYCGHGGTTSFSTTGFSNSDITSLTNVNKLPVVIATACVVGDFINNTCLGEAFLRARNNDTQPKGAAVALMSTINQSWDPPMEGQDEMNAILRGARANNKKTIFGAIAMDGCMAVNDKYNTWTDPDGGNEITDTWTLFGDPT